MATHKELLIDWNMLDNDCNNWTLQDLQLAAELGRTLLERNEELETELKEQQIVIDDRGQEIEFLTKQVNSMKEESASRSKFYEQLESSICELERTNSQLGRKHEVDKKRVQSLCENLEYLERKCEELNVTLQSLRNEQGKKPINGGGKVNRSSYFSFGSDSSEEEMSSGFGLGGGSYRKKSHSLQDLRDYTPSPDEFDSGNSNSPDLKSSETEFIDSLETRIEELQSLRKKESDKVRQLETQIKLLIQENANLQQQIVQISSEKDEEISELRRHLKDSSNYNSQLNASFSAPLSSTRRNSETNSAHQDRTENAFNVTQDFSSLPFSTSSIGIGSSISSINRFVPPVCKRCSAEINVLNLVNSIEHDNDLNCYEWEFGSPEDENMEFSSLEHELARATGTPYQKDNRFINASINNNNNNNHNFVMSPARRSMSSNGSSTSSVPSPKKLARSKKLNEFLRTNPSQIDIEEMDYENSEIFDIFFGHDDKDETGEDALMEHSTSKVRFSQDVLDRGSSSTDEENERSRMDEDPCLIKDRKPEFAKNKSGKSKSKKQKSSSASLSNSMPLQEVSESNGCVNNKDHFTNLKQGNPSKSVVNNLHTSNSRFLELPTRIPSDDEFEISRISSAERNSTPNGGHFEDNCKDNQIDNYGADDILERDKPKGSTLPYKKRECSSSGYDSEYSSTSTCKPGNRGTSSSSECSTSDSEVCGTLSSSASTVSISSEEHAYPSMPLSIDNLSLVSSPPQLSTAAPRTSSIMPEYKQILHSLFSMFNNSKRKYPIPMYPFIQEARRQSSGPIYNATSKK